MRELSISFQSCFCVQACWADGLSAKNTDESYYVSEWVGFDWILSSQGNTTEDDEDENEVGEVGVMDEVVAGNSQTENGKKITEKGGLF